MISSKINYLKLRGLLFALMAAFLLLAPTAALCGTAYAITAEAASSGWEYRGGQWYLHGSDGSYLTGWQKVDGKWYYLNPSGSMATGWQKIGNKWFYLGTDGVMASGITTIGDKTYLLDPNSGAMAIKSWLQIDGKWYHADGWGYVQTGWQKIGNKWFYLGTDGVMASGITRIGDKTYLLDPNSGAMAVKSWLQIGGEWYHADGWGYVQTGWTQVGNSWYYLDPTRNGAMAKNRIVPNYDGNHFVNGYGIMQVSTPISYQNKLYYANSWGVLIENNGHVVVLDPGHSSKVASGTVPLGPGSSERKDADSLGTRGVVTKVWEYELNLTMSFKIQKELQLRGYTVYLTRTDSNSPLDCIKRAQIAADKNADIFVRIHANNDPRDASRTGAMTICITEDNPYHPDLYSKSYLLSSKLLDAYVAATGCRKEEVWETDTMTGNNWSTVPATLIELGYMSNAAEDRKMQDSAYQAKMAQGVADGIDAYFEAVQ